MASHGLDLRKLSFVSSVAVWSLTAAFLAAGLWLHPAFHIGTAVFGVLWIFDVQFRFFQAEHAILRNFGLFGWARYMLESIGPELRQYWIASDIEERPFSRRQRAEVYRYAKDEDVKSAAFGTLADLDYKTIRHSMFPVAVDDLVPYRLTFGEERDIEKAYTITKPFIISAMSFGALGEHAVRALSRGARLAGIPINTGEGGWPKYHLMEGPEVIFQMGTAKFGIRNADSSLNEDLLRKLAAEPQIKMIEIKFSQGAKPGKGGLLPAAKVTPEIAELRGVPMGKDVYSPPRHLECDTTEHTVHFIRRVQEVSQLPVGIKMCLGREEEFRELIAEMKRQDAFPDYLSIDGAEGGTGAAPQSFMDNVGICLFPALKIVTGVLVEYGVRDRLKLLAAGKLISPGMQIKALAMGADAVYTARGFMLSIGCIQAVLCNTGNCPVGVTTHDPALQRGLDIEEKSQRVANYVKNLEHNLFELLAATGVSSLRDLTTDILYGEWGVSDPGTSGS